jgi:GAF domain-containing protein
LIAEDGQRSEIDRLVREQEALRRVAALAAEGVEDAELFAGAAEEVAKLFEASSVTIDRYDGTSSVALADWPYGRFPVGSRRPLDGDSLLVRVLATGKPARIDDYSDLPGPIAEAVRQTATRSAVGAPIVVDGELWGLLCVGALEPMPPDTEVRLAAFTQLLATAIVRGEARERLGTLVEEHAALRRVAILVAQGVPPSVLFNAVADEVARLFDVAAVTLSRYEGDACVVLADPHDSDFPVGSRWPLNGDNLAARVLATGKPARIDDYTGLPGAIAEQMRLSPSASAVGVPIVVDANVWGVLTVGRSGPRMPPDTVQRVSGFTELVAAALASADAREHVRDLVEEQTALRRVATLVAEGIGDDELFAVVAEEVGRVVGVPAVSIDRYEPDGSASVVLACWHANGDPWWPVGSRWPVDPGTASWGVYHTGRPARLDAGSYASAEGAIADALRSLPRVSVVGVPIEVDGKVWGIMGVAEPDGDPFPVGTEERLIGFTELVATAISNADVRDRLRGVGAEQAALRRVATLVAEGAPTAVLLDAVATEVGRLLGVPTATVGQYGAGPSFTVVAATNAAGLPVGSQWPLDGPSMAKAVFDEKCAARIDDYSSLVGTIADAVRSTEILSAVGSPIMVDGSVWGFISVSPAGRGPLPANTEDRLAQFTELVATAIANSQARDNVRTLVDEQTALRRLAILVAVDAPASEMLSAVAAEAGHVLSVPGVSVDRYNAGGTTSTVVATWGEEPFPVGSEWPVEKGTVSWTVFHTGAPARVDDYSGVAGTVADELHELYADASIVGVPIVVEGRVWGMIGVGIPWPGILPADTEARLGRFTDLVATAISNAEAREVKRTLADEQVALRRVATLVARGARGSELFPFVTEEIGRVLEVPVVTIDRYDPDRATTVLAAWSSNGTSDYESGSRWPLDDGPSVAKAVLESGRPARIDDYSAISGTIAERLHHLAHASSVGVPIVVDGAVWGLICVGLQDQGVLPADTETRLSRFTDLVATAISNTEARDRVRRLADEQRALHHVAELVGRGTDPIAVFDAVCEETCRLIGAALVNLVQFTPDGFSLTIAGWSLHGDALPVGTRYPVAPGTLGGKITQTGAPARMESDEVAVEELASFLREHGVRTRIGAPVVVEGKLWGALIAATTDVGEALPSGTEERLTSFTELIATAISNAASRRELIASRARIVAAGDAERRRVERNLHDGIQQRLIALGLDLQAVRSTVSPELKEAHAGLERVGGEVESILWDVRELSRGLHPALLARAGLGPSLRTLARRSPIPVELSVELSDRLPGPIEIGAYYVVSEALTNAIKHSQAERIAITVSADSSSLTAVIEDDGVGGATAGEGSGILGLADRVEALGGRFALSSPSDGGTRVAVEFPLAPDVDVPTGEY